MKKILLFLLLITLSFGCQKGEERKRTNQEVFLPLSTDPPTLDSRKANDNVSLLVINQTQEGLMRKDLSGNLIPGLAERYDVSDDGMHYTFYLRDALWSNGEPINADDFERTWKSALSSTIASPQASEFYVLKNGKAAHTQKIELDAVGVRAQDPKTLQVELDYPNPHFLSLVAVSNFCPVPKSEDPYVSSGPFILKEWRRSDIITLAKNPNYWEEDKVKLEKIHFYIIEDCQTAFHMFQKGEVDWMGFPVHAIPQDLINHHSLPEPLVKIPYYCNYFYMFNPAVYPLTNAKVRRALSLAINREEIVENITERGEETSTCLVPPTLWQETYPAYFCDNTEEAKRLFAEGLEELGTTLDNLPPITLSYNTFETHHKIAQAIQQQWARTLGIRIQLQNKEWKVFLDDTHKGNYEIARRSSYSMIKDPLTFLEIFTEDHKVPGWTDPEYERLLTEAKHTNDPAAREAVLRTAEALLMSEMPIAPLYFHCGIYIKKPYIKDVYISPFVEMILREAYIATDDTD